MGYARSKLSKKDLQEKVKPNLKGDKETIADFLEKLDYEAGPYDEPEGYQKVAPCSSQLPSNILVPQHCKILQSAAVHACFVRVSHPFGHTLLVQYCHFFPQAHKRMCERENKHSNDPKGRLFYLALPPSVYPEVTQGIKENCSDVEVGKGGFVRVIVEKPFGKVVLLLMSVHACQLP